MTHDEAKRIKQQCKTDILLAISRPLYADRLQQIDQRLYEYVADCCATCPLVGIIPKVNRPKGTKETHCCLGTMEALSGRGINVRASEKDSRHPWHRPCDNKWQAWMLFPKRTIHVNSIAYIQCRVPYEQSRQLTFKFHK